MAVVGSAEVIVRAITTQVKKDIQKAFEDARPVVQAEGRKAAKDYAGAFGQTLSQSLEKELRGAVSGATGGVEKDLKRDLVGATERSATEAADKLERIVGGAGGRAGRNAAQSFGNIFGKEFQGALGRLMNLSSIIDILGPGIANLVGGLSSLVSGLFAVGVAAAQAASSLAVLPSLFGVLGQAFGAIKLGFGGVGEAVKAGAKAQEAAGSVATTAAKKQQAAAAKVTAANQKVKDSQEVLRKATDALRKARDKANQGAEEQQAAEARLAASKANLGSVLSTPGATAGQGAAAQKQVDDAKASVDAISKARSDAQKKLRKSENDAADAQRKVAAAQKARDNAQKTASAGGVQSPAIKAANAYADALAKLTPEAQAFVKEILNMRKAFKEVGDEVARNMFPSLTKALQVIEKSRFFEILKKQLGETGKIVGDTGLAISEAFTTKANMGRFEKFLQNNNDIMKILTKQTEDGITPIQGLVSMITKLGVAIQPVTKRFVTWVGTLVTAAATSKQFKTTALENFFKRSADRAAQLGDIVGNLFGIIRNLAKAAFPAGSGLLKSFQEATQKLEDFTSTDDNQKKLKKFFEGVADNVRAIGELITAIGDEFLQLGDNKGPQELSKSLLPAIRSFGDLADKLTSGEVGKALGDLGNDVADLMNSLTQSGQTEVFLKTLSGVTKALKALADGFNKIPFSGFILGAVAVNRALSFSAKLLGFGKSLDFLKKKLTSPFKNALAKGFDKVREAAGKIKNKVFSGTEDPQHKGPSKAQQKKIAAADAENAKANAKEFAEGEKIGKAFGQGFAAGIKGSTDEVVKATHALGGAAVDALRDELDTHSPSRKAKLIGAQTGEGFELGLESKVDDAYRGGKDLGIAAAKGAASVPVKPAVAGAAGVAGPSVAGAIDVTPATKGLDAIEARSTKATKGLGKIGGSFGKLGGAMKGFGGLLSGLVGGPFGLLLTALPLLIAGFTALYKSSPQFRKFVDGIVKAIKPVIEVIGGTLIKVLNGFFGWINKNLPKIGKWVSDVFGKIVGAIKSVFIPIWNNVLLPAFNIFMKVVGVVFKAVKIYYTILFEAIKFYITKIFIPVWKLVFSIIKRLIPVFRTVFNVVAKVVKIAFNLIGKYWNNVLKPIFNAIKKIVATVKNAFANAFDGIGKIFDKFKDGFQKVWKFIKDIAEKIKGAFGGIGEAIGNAFKGLGDKVKDGINTFIDFINKHMIGPINSVTSKFGLKINDIPGFAEGGHTGPGAKNQVAGLVHADEFVINKAARRKIESTHPGLLSQMNKTGKVSDGTGGFHVSIGGIKDLAGDTIGGIKDFGEKIAKEGMGKALQALVKAAENGMGAAGIKRGPFMNDFMYAIMDKLSTAVKTWGGEKGQQPGGFVGGGAWGKPFAGSYPVTQNANKGHNPSWAVDFGTPDYTKVLAASSGSVLFTKNLGSTSYGNYMVLEHAKGIRTLYAHLSGFLKKAGDSVSTGDVIGYSGHSGGVRSSTGGNGAHLHFEFLPSYDSLVELRKRGVKLAKGGIAQATPGGVLSVIAEAGHHERVEPLDANGLSKRDKEFLRTVEGAGGRGVTININNPAPERSSQSVAKAVRNKAVSKGWNN